MKLAKLTAKLFGLDEKGWERHANPWSVWTRNTVLPLLVISVWSHVWLGWWAIVPVCLSILWMIVNPKIFPKPSATDNWASKAVFGERVWMNREEIPIPQHFLTAIKILNIVAALGIPFIVWGVVALDVWITLFGMLLVYTGKLWFLDRMVWLYDNMKDKNPEYKSWLQ